MKRNKIIANGNHLFIFRQQHGKLKKKKNDIGIFSPSLLSLFFRKIFYFQSSKDQQKNNTKFMFHFRSFYIYNTCFLGTSVYICVFSNSFYSEQYLYFLKNTMKFTPGKLIVLLLCAFFSCSLRELLSSFSLLFLLCVHHHQFKKSSL